MERKDDEWVRLLTVLAFPHVLHDHSEDSIMAALQSIGGLISGLQTEDIITKLTEFKKQPVDLLTAQKTKLTEKLTAWQNVNARMLAVKLKAADLQNASAFNAKQVVSSNTSALSVSASDTATVGSYRIKIVQLAQAHQLGSAISYANLTGTALGTGSITIKNVSSGASTIVDIATGADSLTAVRDAINASGADVVANIVNDGTTTPYRLVLTSASTGLDGEMEITTNLTGGAGLAFDGATSEITAAQNAEVTMGTTNPITIESSTNTITTLISGVS
ncbi:MAG: flagellar cap protein FliD N-terminal domain-containing protein, partial [Armatimonadota bacterium]